MHEVGVLRLENKYIKALSRITDQEKYGLNLPDLIKDCGDTQTLLLYEGSSLQFTSSGHFALYLRIVGMHSVMTLVQTDLQGRIGCVLNVGAQIGK